MKSHKKRNAGKMGKKSSVFSKSINYTAHIWKPFLFESAFIILSFFAMVYARNKLAYYIEQIKIHSAAISELQNQIVSGAATPEKVMAVLEPLKAVILHAQALIYFFLPAVIFVLFVVFDGMACRSIGESMPPPKHYKFKPQTSVLHYLFRFAALFLPLYLVLVWMLFRLSISFYDFFAYGSLNGSLLLALAAYILAVFYIYSVAIAFMEFKINEILKKVFYVSLGSLIKIIPFVLILMLASAMVLLPFSVIYVMYISAKFSAGIFFYSVSLAAAIFLCAAYKRLMIGKIRKILG